jgi:hypothetical protein
VPGQTVRNAIAAVLRRHQTWTLVARSERNEAIAVNAKQFLGLVRCGDRVLCFTSCCVSGEHRQDICLKVTGPQVDVDGKTAWITYVNRGSLEDATRKEDLGWLESAVLRKEGRTWRIHFFHSARIPSE